MACVRVDSLHKHQSLQLFHPGRRVPLATPDTVATLQPRLPCAATSTESSQARWLCINDSPEMRINTQGKPEVTCAQGHFQRRCMSLQLLLWQATSSPHSRLGKCVGCIFPRGGSSLLLHTNPSLLPFAGLKLVNLFVDKAKADRHYSFSTL
jgi:hypothetical protein